MLAKLTDIQISKLAKFIPLILITLVLGICLISPAVNALQNPQSGSLGLEATIPSPPPSTAASIAVPANGQLFNTIPITISGICPGNLLIKIYDNSVFVGSSNCANSSYALKIDLFSGSNSISAQDFDALGQGGPLSNTVNVTYTSANYTSPTQQVVITSDYADMGANPGQQLTWPIIISGGTPPYAISTDWGDGQAPVLQSSSFSGSIDLNHVYSSAGIYTVTVTVTDNNGSTGFLQLVGIANGKIAAVANSSTNNGSNKEQAAASSSSLPWWLFAIVTIGLIPTFWLGSRHGATLIHKKLM